MTAMALEIGRTNLSKYQEELITEKKNKYQVMSDLFPITAYFSGLTKQRRKQ